ncbi:MAG: GNAT family N-acetyltransferase, partial [Microcoleus sp. CAN_BIN18]|nr:GNAT family N-acetyltransferase [Microcoleus sp. CAN_BIN18]
LSPYGYPGILLSDAASKNPEFVDLAMKELIQIWRKKNICSAFLRLHPILNDDFNKLCQSLNFKINGETVSVNLTLSDAEIWHDTRPEHRTKINKCKRLGFKAEICPFEDKLKDFLVIYEETMDRVGATSSYYFGEDYFRTLKRALGDKLHLCMVKLENKFVCGGVFTECCGIIQYHLGGSKNEFLKQAPTTLMFDSMRFWGKQRGNQYFHLGGGLGGSKDSLYHFKAGFSKQRHTFLTLRLIIDDEKYRYLVELCAKSLNTEPENLLKSDFFPAYRSPKIR